MPDHLTGRNQLANQLAICHRAQKLVSSQLLAGNELANYSHIAICQRVQQLVSSQLLAGNQLASYSYIICQRAQSSGDHLSHIVTIYSHAQLQHDNCHDLYMELKVDVQSTVWLVCICAIMSTQCMQLCSYIATLYSVLLDTQEPYRYIVTVIMLYNEQLDIVVIL